MNNIEIREVAIEEVLSVHQYVLEMDDLHPPKEFFTNRYKNCEHVITVAYYQNKPVGYMIGYDKFQDDKENFYCWMAGVDYRYRRIGVLTKLMEYQMNWSRDRGYKNLRIKTRNDKRAMLSYLVKNGWNFTEVDEEDIISNSSIHLVIQL